MSDKDKHILEVVRQVLNEELNAIVAIFKANQPEESSRMVRLVSDTVKKELEPIIDHLNRQDIEIQEIKSTQVKTNEKLDKVTTETAPLVEGKNTASSIFKFVAWTSPLAIIYGVLKWLKI